MRKILLFLLLFLIPSCSYAVYFEPQNDGFEVDYESIVRTRTSVTGWVKDYNYGQYDKRNLKKVSFVMYHSTAFCDENRLTNLAVAYYDRKGRLIDIEQRENIHYLDVMPTTISDKLQKALCVYKYSF